MSFSTTRIVHEYLNPPCYYELKKYDHMCVKKSPSDQLSISLCEQMKVVWEIEARRKSIFEREEVRCVVSKTWYDKWKVFMSPSSQGIPPGRIDNLHLVDNSTRFLKCLDKGIPLPLVRLKKGLIRGEDFVLIHGEDWRYLFSIYGGKHNGYGPTIPRCTYRVVSDVVIDLYPLVLKCAYVGDIKKWSSNENSFPRHFTEFRFSKFNSFRDMREVLMKTWDINPRLSTCRVADTRVFVARRWGRKFKLIGDFRDRLREDVVLNGSFVLLEPRFLTEKYQLDRGRASSERKSSYIGGNYFYHGQRGASFTLSELVLVTLPSPSKDENKLSYVGERVQEIREEEERIMLSSGNDTVEVRNKELRKREVGLEDEVFVVFRYQHSEPNSENEVETVMALMLPEREKDVFEEERMMYMLEMEYDLQGVQMMELSLANKNLSVLRCLL